MNAETPPKPSIWYRMAQAARMLFWLTITALLILQVFGQRDTAQKSRDNLFERFQSERKSRVIALIHRQANQSVFGVQVSGHIDIEDSEAVLRAIRLTPDDQPIDLILHTPGGLVLAAEQIASALSAHKGKVTVFIPHYAMSGGTLIAMAAAEIVMDRNAVLGPVDPQIGGIAAASILKAVEIKKALSSDETLMMADMAAKARVQVASFIADLLSKRLPRKKAEELAIVLSEGRWTHDFPITVRTAQEMGFPVRTDMPKLVYELMDLYPQSNTRRPSVIYVPTRNAPALPAAPAKGDGSAPLAVPKEVGK